jgi:VanZ family protein
MAMIFSASTDLGSMHRTSRIIGPFLRFFSPNVSDETIHNVQVAVRKGGHVSGYAVLAALVWRARRRGMFVSAWDWKAARFAEFVAILYAITDEFHQAYVPTRQGSFWDVLLDAAGAALGLAVVFAIGRFRRKW